MDKYNSWKRTEDIEIDLADLLFRLCRRWKQAAVCALAAAVLMGGYSFYRNRSGALQESVEMKEAELTQEEQEAVEAAILLAGETEELEEYLENSILMQTDPYRRNRVVFLYSISGVTNRTKVKVMENYLSFLTCGGVTQVLKEADDKTWGMESQYLEEVILAWQRTDSTYRILADGMADADPAELIFYVEVTGKDNAMARQLAAAVHSALKMHYKDVKKTCGSHTLSLVSREESVKADSSLQTQQSEKKNQLETNKTSLKTMTDGFSRRQMDVFETETGRQGREEEKEEERIGNVISVKYVLLGLFAGMCVYCGIYLCCYLLSGTVKSGREFSTCYAIPFFGSIVLKNGNSPQSHTKDGTQVLNRIRLSCRRQNTDRLCLAADFKAGSREREYLEQLAGQLRESGIAVMLAEDVSTDISVWDSVTETKTVVMIVKEGTTTHQMIDNEMRFYLENGVTVMGAAMLDYR